MKTMTKTLITLAAMAASLTAMTPMMADAKPMTMKPVAVSFHHDRLDPAASARIDARIAGLRGDIKAGERHHTISVRQAGKLTDKLDAVAADKRRDDRNGLTTREAASLNASLDSLSAQVRMAGRR